MDIILIILAFICLIAGIIGSVAPIIPGPPLSYIGIILLELTDKISFSWTFLIVWLIIVIFVQFLDNILPAYITKKTGGSKWAVWGSIIGCIVGFFFTPIGIILGTFLGAVIGELLAGKQIMISLKAGVWTFVGFMVSTGLKLITGSILLLYSINSIL